MHILNSFVSIVVNYFGDLKENLNSYDNMYMTVISYTLRHDVIYVNFHILCNKRWRRSSLSNFPHVAILDGNGCHYYYEAEHLFVIIQNGGMWEI